MQNIDYDISYNGTEDAKEVFYFTVQVSWLVVNL